MKLSKRNIKYIILALFIILTGLLIHLYSSLIAFQNKALTSFKYANAKVYGHRGGIPNNTSNGMYNYFQKGIKNIEIDLFFIDNQFYLAHDLDKTIKEKETLELALLNLEKQGANLEELSLWLDFKNLNKQIALPAAEQLVHILDKFGLKERSFVESKKPNALKILAQKGIFTVYWINPHSKSAIFYLRNIPIMYQIAQTPLMAISMPFQSYNKKVRALYRHLDVLLFTVNDENEFQKLKKYPEVKIIIRD